MSVGTQIAQTAGTQTVQFDPVIAPILPVGDLYSCHATAAAPTAGYLAGQALSVRYSSGTTVATDSYGHISATPVPIASDGRYVIYLGFNMQDVITSTQYPIDIQFGYRSVLDQDLVSIYQFGRFHLPASDAAATIVLGGLVYPSVNTAGLLADLANTATDGSHACPAYGWCVTPPATAGADIFVEVMLIGGGAVGGR